MFAYYIQLNDTATQVSVEFSIPYQLAVTDNPSFEGNLTVSWTIEVIPINDIKSMPIGF
ncbi:hypothetical protein KH5_11380 [Urechidicola sp. KH5]